MNISSISTGTSAFNPTTRNNSEIRMLEKQKERLEDQIKSTKESSADAKTKQELIKQLQEQIQQIETQIQQKRNEKMTESVNKNSNGQNESKQSKGTVNGTESGTGNGTNNGNGDLSGMSDLIEASSSFSKVRMMNSTKDALNGKGNILEQEIKMDESRGVNPKAKRAELAEAKSGVQMLSEDIGKELQTSNDHIEEAAESEGENSSRKEVNEEVEQDAVDSFTDKNEKDPLTWLLDNDGKYSKVDVQI